MVRKILLIEDDDLLRKVMVESFLFHNFDALEADTGALGVQLSRAQLPDIILCDVRLPDFSGLEVATRLQQNPNTASIPLILVTGSELDIAEVKKKYGALIRVVSKPFSVSDLINTVKKSLNQIDTRRQAGPDWESPQDAGCYGSTRSF